MIVLPVCHPLCTHNHDTVLPKGFQGQLIILTLQINLQSLTRTLAYNKQHQ